MKYIKILMIVFVFSVLQGCSNDEMIELSQMEAEVKTECQVNEDSLNESEEDRTKDKFVVYVCGEVRNPGVYELKEGSRVFDAVAIAGGYTEDACESYLNLAGIISDEEKIYVPAKDEINQIQQTGLENIDNQGKEALININRASKEELMTIPGIGESKAEKIIAYREEHGAFSSPEGIMQISGIKEGMYNKIKDKICTK